MIYKSFEFGRFTYCQKKDINQNMDFFLPHIHDGYEIAYFVSGDADYLIEGNIYHLKPNTLLIMRPCELHCIRPNPSVPYERYIFQLGSNFVSNLDFADRILTPFISRPLGTGNMFTLDRFGHDKVNKLFDELSKICENDTDAELKITSRLYMILSYICEAFEKGNTFEQDYDSTKIDKIIEFINLNLCYDINVSKIGNEFSYSASQLNRLFNKYTGMPIGKYITSKRLHRARELLYTGMPAGKVGADCGFADYSSFYRAYVSYFDTSPASDTFKKNRIK